MLAQRKDPPQGPPQVLLPNRSVEEDGGPAASVPPVAGLVKLAHWVNVVRCMHTSTAAVPRIGMSMPRQRVWP